MKIHRSHDLSQFPEPVALGLVRFAKRVQEEKLADLEASGYDINLHIHNYQTSIKPGAKYTKIDVGSSGAFMVDNETGEIFGIKAYGKIHRGHPYGTLATIDEWNWAPFYPVRRKQNG